MAHPAIIRTDFASAEDVAEAFGISASRVKTIQRLLAHGEKAQPASLNEKNPRQTKAHDTSRIKGKKRRGPKRK